LANYQASASFEDAAARSVEVDFEGVRFRVISLEDPIAAKNFAGREKDQPALTELRVIQQKLHDKRSHEADTES
jgi:predicted nucleotidyltransferase